MSKVTRGATIAEALDTIEGLWARPCLPGTLSPGRHGA